MSLNKVSQRLAKRPINDIKQLKRFVRELKTPQAIGSGTLQVSLYSNNGTDFPNLVGPLTIPAGNMGYFTVTIDPAKPVRTLYDVLYSVYVDPVITGGQPDWAHKLPSGSSILGNGNGKTVEGWHFDYDASDDNTTFNRVYYITLINLDTVSHDYYILDTDYAPTL